MALGVKQYETRHWEARQTGVNFLIHAAKRKLTGNENFLYNEVKDELKQLKQEYSDLVLPDLPDIKDLPYGCILMAATLEKCMLMVPGFDEMRPGKISISHQSLLERLCGVWEDGRFAWAFSEPMRLEAPIPHIGRQGIYFASDELIQRVNSSEKTPIINIV
jgi:hypothetical protein